MQDRSHCDTSPRRRSSPLRGRRPRRRRRRPRRRPSSPSSAVAELLEDLPPSRTSRWRRPAPPRPRRRGGRAEPCSRPLRRPFLRRSRRRQPLTQAPAPAASEAPAPAATRGSSARAAARGATSVGAGVDNVPLIAAPHVPLVGRRGSPSAVLALLLLLSPLQMSLGRASAAGAACCRCGPEGRPAGCAICRSRRSSSPSRRRPSSRSRLS